MSEQEILEKIIAIFSEMTEAEEIREDSELIEDLELSSIDVFTLLAEMETEFGISIPEKLVRKMGTIEDVKNIVVELMEKR